MKSKYWTIKTGTIFHIFLVGNILWLLLIILAPLLKSYNIDVANWIYFYFEPLCHQMVNRSIVIASEPMAVCARCFSVYLGVLLYTIYTLFSKTHQIKFSQVIWFCTPAVIDFVLEKFHLYNNIQSVRIISGLILGVAISKMVIYSISDNSKTKNLNWKLNHGKSKIN